MATGDKKDITYFAETDFRNKRTPFGIKPMDRLRHFYVVGKTGMGKSTLLERMTIQDINNGNGIGYIDPHGSSAELFLDYIPADRIKDVIYFAPHDLDFPIAFNVMEDVGKDQRHLVANGLMAAFKKIWPDVWSARMEYISTNIVLALLEYPDSTLLGVNRMLSDKVYRKKVVDNVTDPVVKSFWVDEFAKYSDKLMVEAGASIQNKFGQFVSNPLIRNIVGQPKSTFNIRDVMDGKKILIMNLSKGRMGELNANLIGGMLITKIYLAAMSRASESAETMERLAPFYFVVDEFQSFVNESFRDILSEARKYNLSLTLAHQYIEQVPEEVRDAVFGNVGTTVAFRVGPFDAEVLEKVFGPKFIAEDLVNLGFAQIYITLMIDGVGSAPFSAKTLGPISKPEVSHREEVVEYSRKTYARPRDVVEDEIKKWHETEVVAEKPKIVTGGTNPIQFNTAPRPTTTPATSGYKTPYKTPFRQGVPSFATPAKTPSVHNKNQFKAPIINKVETPAVKLSELPAVLSRASTLVERNKVELPPTAPPAESSELRSGQAPVSTLMNKTEQPARMSLNDLAKNSPNKMMKPKSTGVNIGDLKSAIAEALKSGQNKQAVPQVKLSADSSETKEMKEEFARDDKKKPEEASVSNKVETKTLGENQVKTLNEGQVKTLDETRVKEVPEAVLRKILDTETNK